ncbi:MAG: hypothetical protein HYW85_01590, partial [Deltaproteobacteria bacterium]|nr:hypothetical protein [Deltaproteobacteria bacterium]
GILFLLFSVSLAFAVPAGPHLETRTYDGSNVLNPPYGFVWNSADCFKFQAIVLDALTQAAQDVRVRCERGDIVSNGITYQNAWSLKGTFKVLVE